MLKKLFTEHPQSVHETYLEHMFAALSFAFYFGYAFFAAVTHAFLPFLFVKTGSQIVEKLNDKMILNRHRLKNRKAMHEPNQKNTSEQEYELEYVI